MNDNPQIPHCPVKSLNPGDRVSQFFQIRKVEPRKTRSGQDFLDMTLGDVSGAIDAKLWPEGVRKWGSDFGAQAIVKVVGRVETYRETKQLVVEKIRLKDDREEIDYSLIVKSSPTDPQELYSDLTGMAKDLQPPDLSRLVLSILDKVRPRLLGAPAARMLHHAYKGGLIEHMTDVTNKAKAICEFVPDINRNMVIAGAILHDIGKTLELKTDVNSRTTEGKLVGHLILGSNLITEAAMELGIKEKPWLPELQHIVLAHHGEAQFGSPVNPLTREALIVHFIDNLDAKLKMMEEALSQVDDEGFTPYNKWLNGRIFAGVESLMEEEDAGN